MKKFAFYLVLLAVVVQMIGCAAVNSYPLAARAGETITVAVGSPDGMTTANTTVTYTSDTDGVPVDITSHVVAIFDLFPDRASEAWLESNASAVSALSGHSPWQTVVAIDLPDLGESPLPVGTGHLNVTTTAGYPANFLNPHINTVDIALEILPGSGPANPFDYAYNGVTAGDLTLLEPKGHVVISGPDTGGSYGAVEVTMDLPLASLFFGSGSNPMYLIYNDRPDHAKKPVQHGWYADGDSVTVYLIDPTGSIGDDAVRFKVIPDFPGASFTSVKYYDIDGNLVSGPSLSFTHRN